jgi:two-component sensor histidine kinase
MMKPGSDSHWEKANSFALALITCSNTPLMLLDEALTIIAISTSFCRAFAIVPEEALGRRLGVIGAGEWDLPQLGILLSATVSGSAAIDAYEMDLVRPDRATRRLVLNAQKLVHADTNNPRLLVAILDVTETRINDRRKDDLLRDNAILLQELQHRVANSLQIIASVLLQSARRVQSDEARSHLENAHGRVLSVAALQKHLATSTVGDVELRPYFSNLCQSLSAAMIRDHDRVSIEASTDASKAEADVSVSLGLIVTELVINALKYAFPEQRRGKIKVDYRSDGTAWTLSVTDDGVGMPAGLTPADCGLGTTLVQALGNKLDATVSITDAQPGTAVSLSHG